MLKQLLKYFFSFLFLWGGITILLIYMFFNNYFANTVTLEQVVFHLQRDLTLDFKAKLVAKGFSYMIIRPIVISTIVFIFFIILLKNIVLVRNNFFKITSFVIICVYAVSVTLLLNRLHAVNSLKSLMGPPTTFYEDNYINPKTANLSIANKQNLIVIFLESMESTYFDSQVFTINPVPKTYKLYKQNISFSGYKSIKGVDWTQASLFSTFCGVPLNDVGNFTKLTYFFQNITCLPQILKNFGYNNYFFRGDDNKFASGDKFFTQHGIPEQNIYDKHKIAKILGSNNDFLKKYNIPTKNKSQQQKINAVYHSKAMHEWGANDGTLYDFIKPKLQEISKQKKPFFVGILTIDTHFPDGFMSTQKCGNLPLKPFSNVLKCYDDMLIDFITWLQQQGFYNNTKVVIIGDHLSMPNPVYQQLQSSKVRSTLNIFLADKSNYNNLNTNRQFTQIDMLPTILDFLGFNIPKHRLGMGTSLFSSEKTLIEKYGLENTNKMLSKKSRLYESFR